MAHIACPTPRGACMYGMPALRCGALRMRCFCSAILVSSHIVPRTVSIAILHSSPSEVMSESAQTLVWTTDELLRNILGYLLVRYEKTHWSGKTIDIDRATLRQCAEVSHAFSEVAIDILWENLEYLSYLTDLLPSFCCIQQLEANGSGYMVVKTGGPIRDIEWSRFARYAACVRMLRYDYYGSGKSRAYVHPDVITAIAHHAAPQAALPRLKDLDWFLFSHDPRSELADLVPTCLRSLAINLAVPYGDSASYYSNHLWATLLALISRCPDLSRLAFCVDGY
ncbi:hypothetical protein FKP32DRAFT_1468133 [Trametes sanguinea]|nr:hypothetical protein FKP32DRAFT_1468133 [Trametes sanguinea]